MTFARRLLACTLVATSATAVFGAAATLGVTTTTVGAGSAPTSIDCSAATVAYTYSGNTVTKATVTLPASGECTSATVWLTLTDAAGGNAASAGPVAITSGSAEIDVPDRHVDVVKRYHLAAVKP